MKQGWIKAQSRRTLSTASDDTIRICDSPSPSSLDDSTPSTPVPNCAAAASRTDVESVLKKRDEDRCWANFRVIFVSLLGVTILTLYLAVEMTRGNKQPRNSLRFSTHYFVLCVVAGAFSGLPHLIITPLDLVKCRIQTGEYTSLLQGLVMLWREAQSGSRGTVVSRVTHTLAVVYVGWVPTMFGYCLQCAVKFGFFEYFKFRLATVLPLEVVINYRVIVLLLASGAAEFIADIGLAPFEVVKLRLQSMPLTKRPCRLANMIPRMWYAEGIRGFYRCLVPLWFRQVPYTMVKFSAFEQLAGLFFSMIPGVTASEPEKASWAVRSFVITLAGYGAGALCAVVTQPADAIVSKISQRSSQSKQDPKVEHGKCDSLTQIVRELGGWRGLFRGLVARIILFGTLSALQWAIYEGFRAVVELPR